MSHEAPVNHHHRKILHSIFAHPINANIDFKDVEHVLTELGAEVDNKTGSRIGVTLKGHSAAFHHANHSLPKAEVLQIKKFLETCGVTPDAYPL
jgi:hypothetical protein